MHREQFQKVALVGSINSKSIGLIQNKNTHRHLHTLYFVECYLCYKHVFLQNMKLVFFSRLVTLFKKNNLSVEGEFTGFKMNLWKTDDESGPLMIA